MEALPEIMVGGEEMCFANYDMLKDLLEFIKIEVLCNSTVKTVTDDFVLVETPKGEKSIKADTIMVAIGYHSQKSLFESMTDSSKIVYNVGDSLKVRNIMNTIWDANQLAREM